MRELLDKLHLLENSKRYVPVKGSIIQQDIRKLIGNRKDIYIDSSANDRTVNVVQVDPKSGRVYQRYMVGVRSTPPLFRKIKKFLQTSPQQNFKTVPQIQQQVTPPAGDIPDGGSSDVDGNNQDGNADNTSNGSTVGSPKDKDDNNDQYGLAYTQSRPSDGSTAGPPLSTDRVDGVSPNQSPVSGPNVTNLTDPVTMDPTTADQIDGIDSLDNQPGFQQSDGPATDDTNTVPDLNISPEEYSDDDPGNMQPLQRPETEPVVEPETELEVEPEDNQQNTPQDTTQAPLISRQEFNGEYQIEKVGGLIPGIPAVWKIVRYRESIGSGGVTPQDEVISEHPTKKEAEAARDRLYNDYIQQNSNDRPEQGSNNSQQLGSQVLNTNIDKYDAPTTAINIIFDKESSGNIDSVPGDGGASYGGMQVMTDPRLKGAIDEWIRHGMSDDTIDDIKKDKKLQIEIGVWYYTLLYTLLGGKGTPKKRKLAYKAQNLHKDFKQYRTKDHTINFKDKSTLKIPKGIDPRFVYAAMMYNGGPNEVDTKTGVARLATKRYAKDFLKRLKDIKGISDSNQYIDRILMLSGIDKYLQMPKEIVVENSMKTLIERVDSIVKEGDYEDKMDAIIDKIPDRPSDKLLKRLERKAIILDPGGFSFSDDRQIADFYARVAKKLNLPVMVYKQDDKFKAVYAKLNKQGRAVTKDAVDLPYKDMIKLLPQEELRIFIDNKDLEYIGLRPETLQDYYDKKPDNIKPGPQAKIFPGFKKDLEKGEREPSNTGTPVVNYKAKSASKSSDAARTAGGSGDYMANVGRKQVGKVDPRLAQAVDQKAKAANRRKASNAKGKASFDYDMPSVKKAQQKQRPAPTANTSGSSNNKATKNPDTAKLRRLSPKRTYQRNSVNLTTKESNMLTEASMNVSMNGSSAAEVAELLAMIKNAGMPEPKSMAVMAPSGMSPGPIKTSGCGCGSMGEDNVEEEYANEPDETTMDTAYMTKDLAGGLNRPKDKAALRAKDPAIDHSEMRESLRKALEAKYIQEIDIPKNDSAASNMPTQKAPSMKGLPCPSRGYSEQQIKALRKKLEMAMQDKKRPWQSAAFAVEKILKMTNHCYDHAEIVVDKLMDKIRTANGGEFPKKKGFFGGIFDSTKDNTSTELESISKLAGIK